MLEFGKALEELVEKRKGMKRGETLTPTIITPTPSGKSSYFLSMLADASAKMENVLVVHPEFPFSELEDIERGITIGGMNVIGAGRNLGKSHMSQVYHDYVKEEIKKGMELQDEWIARGVYHPHFKLSEDDMLRIKFGFHRPTENVLWY